MAPDLRELARQRGTWAMARKLFKDGVPLERAMKMLTGCYPLPVLTDAVGPDSPRPAHTGGGPCRTGTSAR